MKITALIFCLFAWWLAQPLAAGVAERFTIIGIIADTGEKKSNKSTVLMRDKTTGKNVVLKVGDPLPSDRSFVIKKITRKEITVGDSYSEIVLIPDKFSGTAIESSNVASRNFDGPAFDGEFGDFSYEGGGGIDDDFGGPVPSAPSAVDPKNKGGAFNEPSSPRPPRYVAPSKTYDDDLDSQYYDERF